MKFGLVIHHDPCIIEKNPYDQGTIGCIPNSVPTVFIVFSRYSWEIITHKYPLKKRASHIGIPHIGGPRWDRGTFRAYPPDMKMVLQQRECPLAYEKKHL